MNRTALRRLPYATVLTLSLTLAGAAQRAVAEPPPSLSRLSWMTGSWPASKDEATVEEVWLRPKANLMVGMNRTVTAQAEGFFEFMRIRWDAGGVTFTAWPQGGKPTEFRLKELGEQQVVFENPEHDYPQRVIYRLREGGQLTARIEGQVDGKLQSEEWHWTRQ